MAIAIFVFIVISRVPYPAHSTLSIASAALAALCAASFLRKRTGQICSAGSCVVMGAWAAPSEARDVGEGQQATLDVHLAVLGTAL